MTTEVLALPRLFDAVVAQFAADAAAAWQAPILTGSGTSMPTVDDASSPTGGFDLRVHIDTGGTVGVAGILYSTSQDGGGTWTPSTALGTATSLTLAGVVLELGAGTLILDDEIQILTTAASTPVPNEFGWRQPDRREGFKQRIVWVPGAPNGEAGEVTAPRAPGREPERPLAQLLEEFVVHIEARDDSEQRNERLQYTVCRKLFDAWYRAVYLAAFGTFEIKATSWAIEKKELRAGATLRVHCIVQAVIPDAPLDLATPDTAIVDVVFEEDETEQLVVTAP